MQEVHGTSINDVSGARQEEDAELNEFLPNAAPPEEPPRNSFFKKILSAPTGSGSIGEYIDHPLNFNGERSTARIIRGASGIIGNLDLAVIDIAMGILEFMKPKKQAPENLNQGVVNNAYHV